MRKSQMFGLCFAAFPLFSCSNPSAQGATQVDQTYEVSALQQQVSALQQHLNALESGDVQPPLKLADSGYSTVKTDTGGGTLQWIASKSNGNGVQLAFKVGNPSSATWNKYTLIGTYGKLTPDGSPNHDQESLFR